MEDNLPKPLTFQKLVTFKDLPKSKTQQFDLTFPANALIEAGELLNLVSLEKCRLKGTLKPTGKQDWVLQAHLGATAVQECVITLAPVKTRIEEDIQHRYTPHMDIPVDEPDVVIEMNADVDIEPLPAVLDLAQVALEALILLLPEYPRAPGAELETQVFTEPGQKPLEDADLKPFAGLADLKAKLSQE